MSIDSLAEQLKAGDINLAEWHAGMRDFIRIELITAMELAKGGREFVTQADWGFVGTQAKKQYTFLDRFAQEIAINPAAWLNGRLNQRASLYGQLGYAAFEKDLEREQERAGFTQERRVLGDADHCNSTGGRPGCVELANKGWQPIGNLPDIGDAACYTNCRCTKQYRRPDGAGGWIYDNE